MLNLTGDDNTPDLRRCPHCAELILLRLCPVVAREFVAAAAAGTPAADAPDPFAGEGFLSGLLDSDEDEDGGDTDDRNSSSSPAAALQSGSDRAMFGDHPVLVAGPDVERAFRSAGDQLAPVTHLASQADSPARACTVCANLLPEDLDDRDVFVIGVVGTQGSGKTHFIASAMAEAHNGGGLEQFGFQRFRPAEESEDQFYADYYAPVFHAQQALPKTHMTVLADGRLAPLVFRFEMEPPTPTRLLDRLRNTNHGPRRVSVLVHDLPGEALREPGKRRKYAPILNHADAFVFLVDPMSFPLVRARANELHPDAGLTNDDLGFSQAGLINAIADEIGPEVAAHLPVSITLTKADLIFEAVKVDPRLSAPAPAGPDAYFADIRSISAEVRRLLEEELGDKALARAAEAFPRATYHAIASLGSQPTKGTEIPELRPIRCIDPLISTLARVTWASSNG